MAEHGPADAAREIERMMAEASQELSQAALVEIGNQALNIIVLRTKSGKDADLVPFTSYNATYAKARANRGLSQIPDLAVTGHMLGAIIPQIETGEVALRFLSAVDNIKALAHNEGVDKSVNVKVHTRVTHYNLSNGQRVSAAEANKDKRRKKRKTASREESVSSFQRHQRTPKREFFDVRHPSEVAMLEDTIGELVQGRVEKAVK